MTPDPSGRRTPKGDALPVCLGSESVTVVGSYLAPIFTGLGTPACASRASLTSVESVRPHLSKIPWLPLIHTRHQPRCQPLFPAGPHPLYSASMRRKTLVVEIEKVVPRGQGLARIEGLTVFVPGALPGEKVRVRITQQKPDYARAEILELLRPSPHRVEPLCAVFPRCGGCQWQMVDYPYQVHLKTEIVRDAFRHLAGIKQLPLEPTVPSPRPWHYRNKLQMPVKRIRGKLLMGFYEEGTHYVVDLDHCPVAEEALDHLIRPLKHLIAAEPLTIYDETRHYGRLRHVILRTGSHTGEILVVLVTKDWSISRALADKILALNPQHIIGVAENRNPERTNRILGPETRRVLGNPYYLERVLDYTFRVSAPSFFQVNTRQLEQILKTLRNLLGEGGISTLVDAYAGVGVFAIGLSDLARRVIGIEVVGPAVVDAQENIERNEAWNVEFIEGRAEDVLLTVEEMEVLLVDPPRKGLDPYLLQAVDFRKPRQILYLSCNPATLARDTQKLLGLGYELKRLQPFDMFPHTFHVETLAVFER